MKPAAYITVHRSRSLNQQNGYISGITRAACSLYSQWNLNSHFWDGRGISNTIQHPPQHTWERWKIRT